MVGAVPSLWTIWTLAEHYPTLFLPSIFVVQDPRGLLPHGLPIPAGPAVTAMATRSSICVSRRGWALRRPAPRWALRVRRIFIAELMNRLSAPQGRLNRRCARQTQSGRRVVARLWKSATIAC